MKLFYPSIEDIEQITAQLQKIPCPHCHCELHLLSHGYIYKSLPGQAPVVVGKRVFCSNRRCHQGCGRTCPLYLACCLRFMHYRAAVVARFIALLICGAGVEAAYLSATGALDARQAWRWMDKLVANLPRLRGNLSGVTKDSFPFRSKRRRLVCETFRGLNTNFIQRLQLQTQQLFLFPLNRYSTL